MRNASLLLILPLLVGCSEVCTRHETIVDIGGCGRMYCGVKYSDGSFGEEISPVVGQQKCLKHEYRIGL